MKNSTQEILKYLINQIEILKHQNEQLNSQILDIKKENELKNQEIKNNINQQNIKINDCEEKINLLEERIKKLEILKREEKEVINKKKYDINDIKMIKSINDHKDAIYSVSMFPSGKMISVSNDKSIKIYDINFNLIENIENAHDWGIIYVEIIDENNFITCSFDHSIKTWIKIKNKFNINKTIHNAHNNQINKVIYSNKNLISCSWDKTVKIWEEIGKNYQFITKLSHSNIVWSVLFLKDKNLLISSGYDGTRIWNNNNLELIQYFKSVKCRLRNGLSRMDDDTIIIGGYQTINVISLSKNVILAQIKIPFDCYGIKIIEEKRIILVGGDSKDFVIYKSDSYEYIKTIKNAHNDNIKGFVEFKNGLIASFSEDKTIKIWSF